MTRLNIRIKHHKDGTATVSGIPSTEVRSIFTAAWLYRHDNEKRPSREDTAWWRFQSAILNQLTKPSKWVSGYQNVPIHTLKKHELAVRRRDVVNARRDRLNLDRIIKEIYAERAKK